MKWLKYGAYGFGGIIAAAVLILLAMGQRANAGVTASTIEINKPPAVVWAWLEDDDKFRQWVGWVVDVKTDGNTGIGGKRQTFMKDPNMNGQLVVIDSVLREYDKPRRMAVDLSSPLGFDGQMTYVLEDLGGKTRLSMSGKWHYHQWFAQLMEPLITPQASAKGKVDLARLKALAEQ